METENIAVVADTVTNTAPAAPQNSIVGMLVYLAVVCGIIYLFMYRPQRKRMAEYKQMVDSVKVGNRIMAAGIYGTVKKIGDKTLEMEVAKGVVIEVSKNAVAGVVE